MYNVTIIKGKIISRTKAININDIKIIIKLFTKIYGEPELITASK